VDYASSSDFVMNHMATYTSIGEETVGGHAQVSSSIAYPSEPILAEASAYCTSGLNEFDDDDDDDDNDDEHDDGDAFSYDSCDDDVEDFVAASVDGSIRRRIAKKFAPVYCMKEAVLITVKKQLAGRDPLVTTNKGSLGEFLGCALVGYQLDYIRANKIRESGSEYDPSGDHNNMSSPIPAKDFLCALFQDADENGRLSVLDEYMLNATHFIRLPYKPSNSTCATAFARGAAVITYEGSRTLDFFLEAVRDLPRGGLNQNATPSNSDTDSGQCDESGNVDSASNSDRTPRYDHVHIRVAIKNYANDISRSQADKLIAMAAVNCEPVSATGIAGKEKLSVVVVINIGKGRLEPFVDVVAGSDGATRISLAVGLNFGDICEFGPLQRPCFKYFSKECLRLFREAASWEYPSSDNAVAMSLGNDFNADRCKCQGNCADPSIRANPAKKTKKKYATVYASLWSRVNNTENPP
jgi:hypothetical protein